ncbi:MAG: GH39 family glycosyl hydrolase [Terasakiella sp.]|uniref:GH39 family glycosyl hydrolase n=1 Tax=unclassified Terasakiella TaxID=2614952 RepID=UPI003B000EE4
MKNTPYYFISLCLIGLFFSGTLNSETPDYPKQLTLHLSSETQDNPSFLMGLIHGINGQQPADDFIDQTGFDYWRSGRTAEGFITRLQHRKALYQFVLADSWGFGEHMKPPHELKTEWENHVRQLVRTFKDKVWVWEIWNEPDLKHFWRFSRQEYFETWKIAHNVIREELGDTALIAGPSFVQFDKEYLQDFLDFSLKEKLQIDVLTWHSLHTRISAIPENVAYVRHHFMNNPRYTPLKIKRIHIDEFGGRGSQYSPGTTLTYLWQLENARIDAAAKACWPNEEESLYYCDSDTLSGLVTDDLRAKRAPWWLFAKYNESRKAVRLTVKGQTVWLPALAWEDDQGRVQVLFGLAEASNAPANIAVDIDGPYQVIKAQRLSDQGEAPSDGFVDLKVQATFSLKAGDVIWLVLERS